MLWLWLWFWLWFWLVHWRWLWRWLWPKEAPAEAPMQNNSPVARLFAALLPGRSPNDDTEAKKRIAGLEDTIAKLKGDMAAQAQNTLSAHQEIEKLQGALAQARALIQTIVPLELKIAADADRAAEAEKLIATLEDTIEQLKDSKRAQLEGSKKAMAVKIVGAQKEIERLQGALAQALAENDDNALKQIERLKRLEGNQQEIKQLKDALARQMDLNTTSAVEAQKLIDSLEAEVQARATEVQIQAEAYAESINKLEEGRDLAEYNCFQIEGFTQAEAEAKARISELEARLVAQNSHTDVLLQEAKAKSALIVELQHRCSILVDERTTLREDIATSWTNTPAVQGSNSTHEVAGLSPPSVVVGVPYPRQPSTDFGQNAVKARMAAVMARGWPQR